MPTNRLNPPRPGTEEHRQWSRIHRMPGGKDQARRRSETPPGFASAMALQWGGVAPELLADPQLEMFA